MPNDGIAGTTQDGWTPLHCAASKSHVEVVKALLEAGANPEAQAGKVCTALALGGHEWRVKHGRVLMCILQFSMTK